MSEALDLRIEPSADLPLPVVEDGAPVGVESADARGRRLGETLVAHGWLRPEDLAYALEVQERSGERLGAILLALSLVERRHLYRALSEVWGLPYVELASRPPLPQALQLPLEEALRARAAVYDVTADEVRVAVAERPDSRLMRLLAERFPDLRPQFAVTTHWDIDNYLRHNFEAALLDRAVHELRRRRHDASAHTVLTRGQFLFFAALSFALLFGLVYHPTPTLALLIALTTVGFAVSVLFKLIIGIAGARTEQPYRVTAEEVAALSERELPHYTILVPLYREAEVVGRLLEGIRQLDYPPEKLEVLLLIEEDDEETWQAARDAHPPDFVRFVRIPDGIPKTKPKACNVGLAFARGEFLVIYDAEDRPEPDQLKKVVAAFRRAPPELVCIQAALNYFNACQNWLTRMFTLEYSHWFDYMLPGLDRLGLPIPLGGTSNHFRTDRLRELGGWDPFNVTEDADLGIRAAALGYRVGVVNSTTFEEANSRLGNWIRQRSRWIKGYMQTALVHSRHPLRMLRRLGVRRSAAFALLVAGTPLTFLAYPPSLLLYLYWLLDGADLSRWFPPWVVYLGLANLLFGNALAIYMSGVAVFRRRLFDLIPCALTNPVYWLLHAVAAYKALGQLLTRPFYWEKTIHGLDRPCSWRRERQTGQRPAGAQA